MPRALHVKPFQWNNQKAILPEWKAMAEKSAKQPQSSMAMLLGAYGGSDDESKAADSLLFIEKRLLLFLDF